MRSGTWTNIVTVGVLLLAVRSQYLQAGPRRQAPLVETPCLTLDCEAASRTEQEARELAQDRARERVLLFLNSQRPPLAWPGRDGYVESHLRDSWIQEPTVKDESSRENPLTRVILHVAIPASDYQTMVHLDREARAEERQLLLAKALCGLVAVLAVLATFLKLGTFTRTAGSRWGRVAAIGLLGTLAVGWWLLA